MTSLKRGLVMATDGYGDKLFSFESGLAGLAIVKLGEKGQSRIIDRNTLRVRDLFESHCDYISRSSFPSYLELTLIK